MAGEVVRELVNRLGLDVDEAAFNAADVAFGVLQNGAKNVGLLVAAAAGSLLMMVKSTAAAAGEIDDLSARTGVSARELQAFGYAARLGGVGLDELGTALNFAAKKGVRDLPAYLLKTADEVKRLTDSGQGAAAAALAMERFGKGGARLVPVLKDGSGRLRELMTEAEAVGFVMGDDLVAAGDRFGDNLDRLSMAGAGLRNLIAGPFVAALADLLDKFVRWLAVNREFIATPIVGFFKLLGFALKAIWFVLSPLVSLVGFFVRHWKVLAVFLASVGIALVLAHAAAIMTWAWNTFFLGLAYASLGLSIAAAYLKAAVMGALAMAPMLLLIAAIALAILVVEDLWVTMNGGEGILTGLMERWTKFYDTLLEDESDDWWLTTALKAVLRFLADIEGGFIRLGRWWDKLDMPDWLTMGEIGGAGSAERNAAEKALVSGQLFAEGGASSPAAAAALQTSARPPAGAVANTIQAPISIVQQPGQSNEDLAKLVRYEVEDLIATKNRETAAALVED